MGDFPLQKTLPANTAGRDFVIGDLHGTPEALFEAMDAVHFDETRDRILSVGDLIDRGPDSPRALALLREPWFHAVHGNHEDLLLSATEQMDSPYHGPGDYLPNGGQWLIRLPAAQRDALLKEFVPRLRALPYILTVLDAQGGIAFHLTHAEMLRPSRDPVHDALTPCLTDQEILKLSGLSGNDGGRGASQAATLTWSRRLVLHAFAEKNLKSFPRARVIEDAWLPEPFTIAGEAYTPDLSPVFVGHTILDFPLMHASHLFIDRGAYRCEREADKRLLCLDAMQTLAAIERHVPRTEDERRNACRPVYDPYESHHD